MAISFVCNNSQYEQLIMCIKSNLSPSQKKKCVKIFVVDKVEDLEKMDKSFNDNQIIITKNLSSEFVSCAVEKTSKIIYNSSEDIVVKKVLERI